MKKRLPFMLEERRLRSDRTVDVSASCNQRCLYCAGYAGSIGTDEVILRAMEGLDEVFLDGGEPTLNPELFRYARHARDRGASKVVLVTNGLRLSYRDYAVKCLRSGINGFLFALPSHRKDINDLLTRVEGSFDLKVQALRNLIDLGAGPSVRLVHVVNRHNCPDLPDFVGFVHRQFPEVRSVFFTMMECPEGGEPDRALVPSLTEARPFLEKALEAAGRLGIEVTVNGVPPCIIPDHAAALGKGPPPEEDSATPAGRAKVEECEGCRIYDRCDGVRVDYVGLFGAGEIGRARRALENAVGQSTGGADRKGDVPPDRRDPLRDAEATRPTGEAADTERSGREGKAANEPEEPAEPRHIRLFLDIVTELGEHRPRRALEAMRKLIGVRGAEPDDDQLRAGVARRRLTESTTLRGFKPAQLAVLRHNLHPAVKFKDVEPKAAERFFDENRKTHRIVRSEPFVKNYLRIRDRVGTTGQEPPLRVTVFASHGDHAYRLLELDRRYGTRGPVEAWVEAGGLMDFPPCCVDHYAEVKEKGLKEGLPVKEMLVRSAFRRTRGKATLPFETSLFSDLNLLPFFPCSFRCPNALGWAGKVLKTVASEDVQLADAYFRACGQPVLYFGHAFYILFEGRVMEDTLFYGHFAVNTFGPSWIREMHRLFYRDIGRLLEHGDRIRVNDKEVLILRGENPVARLTKDHPDAALLLCFAA